MEKKEKNNSGSSGFHGKIAPENERVLLRKLELKKVMILFRLDCQGKLIKKLVT